MSLELGTTDINEVRLGTGVVQKMKLGSTTVYSEPATVEYLSVQQSTTDASTYTFSSVGLGTASTTRIICITVTFNGGTGGITSATIAGIAATPHVSTGTFGATNIAILSALVPSGTTGNIVIKFGDNRLRCNCGVFRIVNAVPTVFDTAFDTDDASPAGSISIDVPKNGAVVGLSRALGTSRIATTWTELTEDYDVNTENTASAQSGAHKVYTTAGSPTITATGTGTSPSAICMAAVSFAP